MTKQFSTLLDMSRWMAALLVVISHDRHIVLSDFGTLHHPNIGIQMLYFVTGFGHEAVVIFFVISGFLVGGLTLQKWRTTGVALSDYFAHRISRIYTVLCPALLTGFALDSIGSRCCNASAIYTDAAQLAANSLNSHISSDLTVTAFIGNLLMLESTYVPILGSNGPIWSLAYEWWYYCIFAACAGAVFRKGTRTMALCIASLAVMLAFAPLHMLLWMAIWLLGVAAFFYCESRSPKPNVLLSCGLFAGALVLSRLNTHNVSQPAAPEPMAVSFAYDFAIGLSYALLLSSFYRYQGHGLPFKRLHKTLAAFSYSMYLAHFPMLVIVVAALHDVYGVPLLGQPDGTHLATLLAVAVALYAYGFLFSRATERHTTRVYALLTRWLGSNESCRH